MPPSRAILFSWFLKEKCVKGVDPQLSVLLCLTGEVVDPLKSTNIKGKLVSFYGLSLLHLRARLQINHSFRIGQSFRFQLALVVLESDVSIGERVDEPRVHEEKPSSVPLRHLDLALWRALRQVARHNELTARC